MEEIVIKTITQTEGNTKMYPPYRKERTQRTRKLNKIKSKPKRERKKKPMRTNI